MGKPGVPSWNDATGSRQDRRSGPPDQTVAQEWAAAGPVGGSSRVQAALSRMLAYGLWGGLALALVLGLVNCAGSPAATPPPAAQPAPPPPVAPPGGCAELVVAGWLAGDAELLADVPGVPGAPVEAGRRRAARTYTAAVTPGSGAWGYLVGAEVEVRGSDPDAPEGAPPRWRPAGTQFFAVTMVPATGGCAGWRPAALPAQVPAPRLAGDGGSLPYAASVPTSGTELGETLDAFFAGMLTGTESLERYVAPGVFLPAVVPPPYEQVEVTELRARDDPTERGTTVPPDGTVVQLLATVRTGTGDLPLLYPMTVGVRGGRWEVIAIDPLVAAAVDPAEPAAEPATEPADPTADPATGSVDPTNGG